MMGKKVILAGSQADSSGHKSNPKENQACSTTMKLPGNPDVPAKDLMPDDNDETILLLPDDTVIGVS
jgi:hypothetical protein